MPISEEAKKKLLYGAGAIASIIGVIYLARKSSGSAMPSAGPQYPSGSGSSAGNQGLEAAQLQAATSLTVAGLNQQVALAQIAASTANTNSTNATALAAQKSANTTKLVAEAMTPGGLASKALDSIASLFKGGKPKGMDIPGQEVDSQGNPMVLGASGILSSTANPTPPLNDYQFGAAGAMDPYGMLAGLYGQSPGGEQPYIQPAVYTDFFQGNMGSGDNNWFGSSPSDPVVMSNTDDPMVTETSV